MLKRTEGEKLFAHVSSSLFVPIVSRCVNNTVLIDSNGIFRAAVQVAEF